jgi:hypothetical protein
MIIQYNYHLKTIYEISLTLIIKIKVDKFVVLRYLPII